MNDLLQWLLNTSKIYICIIKLYNRLIIETKHVKMKNYFNNITLYFQKKYVVNNYNIHYTQHINIQHLK